MPRVKQPKRIVEILLDEESVRDALALWVSTYHGIEVRANKIEIVVEDGRMSAKFEKEPKWAKTKSKTKTSSSESGPLVTATEQLPVE